MNPTPSLTLRDLSALDWTRLGRSMTRWYAQLVDRRPITGEPSDDGS